MRSIEQKTHVRNFTVSLMTTVSDILKQAKGFDLLSEIETLLCDYLEVDSAGLFLKREEEVDSNVSTLIQMNMDTLKGGYPLAYIRGCQDFYGLEFKVNSSVLIPRRDTEILASEAADCIQKLFEGQGSVRMLELGVGSGCISVSIAHELVGGKRTESVPGHSIVNGTVQHGVHVNRSEPTSSHKLAILGIEKSREALDVARENVAKYALSDVIKLREGDLLDRVDVSKDGGFDILVANLPYVDENSDLGRGVREHEPHLALFAEDGGLALYRKVLEQILERRRLVEGGFDFKAILFEIGYDQGDSMLEICRGFMPEYEVSLIKDLEGRDRVVKIVKSKSEK